MKQAFFFYGIFFTTFFIFLIDSNSFSQDIEGYLDGKIFKIQVVEKNPNGDSTEWIEQIKFENGKVHTPFAASNGFHPATYQVFQGSEGINFFTAEISNSTGDIMKWSGTFSKLSIDGSAVRYDGERIKMEFLFHASLSPEIVEEINQLDSAGLKHGWWMIYLDANLGVIVKQKSDTVYYRYTYYDHGFDVIAMGSIGSKKQQCFVPEGLQPDHTGYIPLTGEFKSYYANGTIQYTLQASNGYLTLYEEYYKTGMKSHFFDYRKLWNNEPHTFYSCGYNKDGSLKWDNYFHKGTLKNGKVVWSLWPN